MSERITATGVIVVVVIASVLAQGEGQLAGTVRDAAGQPMPAILVELSSPTLLETVRPVATDSRGRYRFERLPPGAYSMTFTLIGSWTERREIRLPSDYRLPFEVRLYGNGESEQSPDAQRRASLKGTVFDQMQGVMPGITLLLTGPVTRTTTSDSRGQFSFADLPTGDYELRGALEAFGTTIRKVTLVTGTTLTMRVEMSVAAIRYGPIAGVMPTIDAQLAAFHQSCMVPSTRRATGKYAG